MQLQESGDRSETKLKDGSLIFKHAVVMLKSTPGPSIVLCARLESDTDHTEAYIVFGISPDGTIEGAEEAIIGLPGSDSTALSKHTPCQENIDRQ